jgi:hypothetical protein
MLLVVLLHNIINNVQLLRVVIKILGEVISFIKYSFLQNTYSGAASSSIWDVTVRVYIGCEYECPRGHRFFCSSPNHIIRVGPNGIVKVCSFFMEIFLYNNLFLLG